jgi:hypothetical protein
MDIEAGRLIHVGCHPSAEKVVFAGGSKVSSCKAPEILSHEAYWFVRRMPKDEGNAANGTFQQPAD